MAEPNGEELEISGPGGTKLRARGSDILGIFQLVLLCLVVYGGYTHTVDAKDDKTAFIQAVKESTEAQKEMVQAQREANCLNRLTPQEKQRQENIEFCRQLGRGR